MLEVKASLEKKKKFEEIRIEDNIIEENEN